MKYRFGKTHFMSLITIIILATSFFALNAHANMDPEDPDTELCDAIYDECISQNPYPWWMGTANAAYVSGCANSRGICCDLMVA